MPLQVHTARISSADPDVLNITRGSGTTGLFLAPSNTIFRAAKAQLRRATTYPEREAIFARYTGWYLAEMRESYVTNRPAWEELLRRPRVVLVCYCTDARHCHRWILRAQILPRLGAIDCGEITGEEGSLRARMGNARGPRVA